MMVTDDVGEQCIADVLYVGLPPSIVLSTPFGSLYSEGESILFVAEVSDSEDSPGDLSISWSLRRWYFLQSGCGIYRRRSVYTSTLTLGLHDITVTVTDSMGLR